MSDVMKKARYAFDQNTGQATNFAMQFTAWFQYDSFLLSSAKGAKTQRV